MLPSYFNTAMTVIGGFEQRPTLAVAVSGGIDSMALLLLADDWAKSSNGKVIALTVDHHLRPESGEEADRVFGWCKARGIEHHTLTWNPKNISSAVQAQARDARYRLLTDWCKTHHVLHLLTGHHRDDQAETLVFRLARGSHLDGLAAMPMVGVRHGVRLIRPLLAVEKTQLQDFLLQQKQTWAHDSSNDETYYTRNAIRAQLTPALCEQAGQLAARIGTLRHQWETEAAQAMNETCEIFPQGYGTLLEKPWNAMPREYALRNLSSIIQTIGGEDYAPRTEKLERLYEEIRGGKITGKRSFGGCILQYRKKQSRFIIYREAKELGADMVLSHGDTQLWDRRFSVSYMDSTKKIKQLNVRALGTGGVEMLKNHLESIYYDDNEKAILPLLPAFWNLEELVAVPHIGYTAVNYRSLRCKAQFTPAKALAAAAFFSLNGRSEILPRKAV